MGECSQDAIRIMVVDDEPIIADELSELLKNHLQDYGNITVRTAYNAATVLKLIAQHSCDILISDIQMPGKSGLELAKEVREIVPDVNTLFLTGFNNFPYAYEAFRQNAVHYLLKTEGDEAILQAVRETVDKLRVNRNVSRRIQEAEQRYMQMVPAYRKVLFTMLLQGVAMEQNDEELEKLFPGECYLVLARMDAVTKRDMRIKLVAQTSMQQIVEDAMGERLLWAETAHLETELVWGFALKQTVSSADVLFPLIRKARKMLEEQCEARMFFMVADAPATVQTLADKYTEVHNALMYDIARGEAGTAIRHTVKTQDQMDDEAQHNYALQHRQLELCESDLRNNALDMLQKHIKPLLDVLRSEQIPVSAFALEYDARLTAMLLNYVNQNGLSSLLQISGFFAKTDLSSRADAMERLIGLMLEGAQKRIDATIKSITHVVIDYINEHISQDIGITDLSRVTGYSTGYLSRVFRQEEGVSIHEYMTTMRMNLARELLINTNMRVYEIAAHCGYDNAAYFIKVFKGNTGCTPQEFKQNNQR